MRKLVRNHSRLLIQRTLRKETYLWRKGSGKVFLPIHKSKGGHFPPRSRTWSLDLCYNDQDERDLDGAIHWNSIHQKILITEEHDNLQKRIGSNTFMKVVTSQGSSTVQIPRILWCIFVQLKDTLVDIWSHRNRWITLKFHTIGKNLSFTHDVLSLSSLFLKLDSLQEAENAGKEDKLSSSHLSNPGDGYRYREKCIITAIGNTTKILFIG